MPDYQYLIDATDFRTVAGYLRGKNSPIKCLLHVKDRQMLASLAETVERELERGGFRSNAFPSSIERLIEEGSVKISLRAGLGAGQWPTQIVPENVNPLARSEVIYMEPFYIVHTPGLFEGKQERKGSKLYGQRHASSSDSASGNSESKG